MVRRRVALGLWVLLSLADGVDPRAVGSSGVGSAVGVAVDVESGALFVPVVGGALQAGVVEVGGATVTDPFVEVVDLAL